MTDTTPPSTADTRSHAVSSWWRALAILLLLVVFVGGATAISLFEQFKTQLKHLQSQLVQQPQIRQVAVLLDDTQQPGMLISIASSATTIQIQRLNDTLQEGREQRLQVWALTPNTAPRSLGILERKIKTPQLPLPSDELQGVQELAVSVEGQDGAPVGRGPNQPWLLKGALINKAL